MPAWSSVWCVLAWFATYCFFPHVIDLPCLWPDTKQQGSLTSAQGCSRYPQMEFNDRPQRISGVITARSFGSHHAHQASRVLAYEDNPATGTKKTISRHTWFLAVVLARRPPVRNPCYPQDWSQMTDSLDTAMIRLLLYKGAKTNGAAYQKSADTGVC